MIITREMIENSYTAWSEGDVQTFESDVEKFRGTIGVLRDGVIDTKPMFDLCNTIPDVVRACHPHLASRLTSLQGLPHVANVVGKAFVRTLEDLIEAANQFRAKQAVAAGGASGASSKTK